MLVVESQQIQSVDFGQSKVYRFHKNCVVYDEHRLPFLVCDALFFCNYLQS